MPHAPLWTDETRDEALISINAAITLRDARLPRCRADPASRGAVPIVDHLTIGESRRNSLVGCLMARRNYSQ
jgi:hypothetical protein